MIGQKKKQFSEYLKRILKAPLGYIHLTFPAEHLRYIGVTPLSEAGLVKPLEEKKSIKFLVVPYNGYKASFTLIKWLKKTLPN